MHRSTPPNCLKQAAVLTVIALTSMSMVGCGTMTGIPSHGGGKRYAEEQRLVSASIRTALKDIDVTVLRGHKVAIVFDIVNDEGGGSLNGGRLNILGAATAGYLMSPVAATSNAFQVFNLMDSNTGFSNSGTSGSGVASTAYVNTGSSGQNSSYTSTGSGTNSQTGAASVNSSGTSSGNYANSASGSATTASSGSSNTTGSSNFNQSSTGANSSTDGMSGTSTGTSSTTSATPTSSSTGATTGSYNQSQTLNGTNSSTGSGSNTSAGTSNFNQTQTGTNSSSGSGSSTGSNSGSSSQTSSSTGNSSSTGSGGSVATGTSAQNGTSGTNNSFNQTTGQTGGSTTNRQAVSQAPSSSTTQSKGPSRNFAGTLDYKGLGEYQNFNVPKSDASLLMGLVRNYLLYSGVQVTTPTDQSADVLLYVTVDVFGIVRSRFDSYVYNTEKLKAETSFEMAAFDKSGKMIMRPRNSDSESQYTEHYLLWAGPFVSTERVRKGEGLLVDFSDVDGTKASYNTGKPEVSRAFVGGKN